MYKRGIIWKARAACSHVWTIPNVFIKNVIRTHSEEKEKTTCGLSSTCLFRNRSTVKGFFLMNLNFLGFLAGSRRSLHCNELMEAGTCVYQGTTRDSLDLINSCHSAWMWCCNEQSLFPLKICYFCEISNKTKTTGFWQLTQKEW